MSLAADIWKSKDPSVWEAASSQYWTQVGSENYLLEKRMEKLEVDEVRQFSPSKWYDFLINEYFPWKYTAANRFATTTAKFYEGFPALGLDGLDKIRRRILAIDLKNVRDSIEVASQIPGIGPAGASGLLSLLYPRHFGTADVFVVEALKTVLTLPERNEIKQIKDGSQLTIPRAVLLVEVMRRKAAELNALFESESWTPRKVDMVLWAIRDKTKSHC